MNQVVVVPYPSRVHIFSLLNLCHLLSNRFNRNNELLTVFTVIVTEEWQEMIVADPNLSVHNNNNIRFVTFPNVLTPESVRHVDTLHFYIVVQKLMKSLFDQLLDSTDLPVKFIIADVMLHCTFEIANRRKIPVAAYWPMSASMFCLLYYIWLLRKNRHDEDYNPGSEKEYADSIPGLTPICLEDLPWPDNILQYIPTTLHDLNKRADCLLLTTVSELEADAIDAIIDHFQKPVYAIGPNLPHFQLQPNLPPAESYYFSWLDSKAPRSVLYVSLGNLRAVSSLHLDEMLAGLNQSGVNFLWTTAGEELNVIGDCDSNGLKVEWCDQWRVLQHASVGGFMSHCDWNSTKESLFLGVPMLTFPITGDQLLNSKFVFNDLRAAWKARTENFVTRGTIAAVVRQFMDLDSDGRRVLMQYVEHVEGLCRASVEEGGPANKEINLFIRDSEKNWDQRVLYGT